RYRLVRKEPDPYLAAALDGSRHGHAGGFDLPRGNPRALHRLEPEFPEGNRRTAPCLAGHAPTLLLSIFDLLRHHHGGMLSNVIFGSRPSLPALPAWFRMLPVWFRMPPVWVRMPPVWVRMPPVWVPRFRRLAARGGPRVSRRAVAATSAAAEW